MNKFLDENGLLYLWSKVKSAITAASKVEWSSILNKPDVVTKSDLVSVYRYKGSVNNYASLPESDNEAGDVWNVEANGMNYAWTESGWDALGGSFEVQAITNAEIDSITSEE